MMSNAADIYTDEEVPGHMNMTNRKIARLANVSPATVSKVFAGSPEISAETAEHVLRIAEECGWTPPKYRKTASARNNRRVSILVPELISYHYAQLVTFASDALREAEIEPDIHITGFSQDGVDRVVSGLIADGLTDGILLLNEYIYSGHSDIPTVIYNSNHGSPANLVVSTEIDTGIRLLITHLHALGHTRIGHISEHNTQTKLNAYRCVMAECGLPVDERWIFISDKRFEEIGYEAAEWFLAQDADSLPTALICAYDEVAIGAMRAFLSAGLRIPEDISVVGINDIGTAPYASIPLTTVNNHPEQRIRHAVRLLTDLFHATDNDGSDYSSPGYELIVRASTAPPRPGTPSALLPKHPIPTKEK